MTSRAKNPLGRLVRVVVAALLGPALLSGSAAASAPEVLAGLRAVLAEVDAVPAEVRELGFTRGGLLLEMARVLSDGGLGMLGDEDFPGPAPSEGAPELVLSLAAARDSRGILAVSIRLELRQEVLTLREPWTAAVAVTWRTSRLALVAPGEAAMVRDAVRDALDDFLADWREANTPEEPPPEEPGSPEGPLEAALRIRG